MTADQASRAIIKKLFFYLQLAGRPEDVAHHVALLVLQEYAHTREELLVAIDWALSQGDLTSIVSQPHPDATLRQVLEVVLAQLDEVQPQPNDGLLERLRRWLSQPQPA